MNPLDRPWTLLEQSLQENAHAAAAKFGEKSHTYAELYRDAVALAAGLSGSLAVGDRAALLVGNRYEYLVADAAILRAGLVKVPLNPMLPIGDVLHILDHSGSRMLLVSRRLSLVTEELLDRIAKDLPHVTVIDVDTEDWGHLLEAEPAPIGQVGPRDPAAIYYTGGTTGLPKGVVHSQASVATNLVAHVLEGEIRRGEAMLLSTALSHSAGAFAAAGLLRGATLVVLDKFDPESFCAAAQTHDTRWAMVVPTMLYRLLDHVEGQGDALTLDTLVYGSAPIAPSRLKQALDVFGPVLVQLFGQTECPNWGTSLTKADHDLALQRPQLLESAGRRSVMAAVKIIGEDGSTMPRGEVGEVCLSAPYVMTEYHRNPDATTATVVDGWVRTRDVGFVDEEGYLFLKDRTSDMIISGGYNVYSSEVEAAVAAMPGVVQVAVIGIPDDDWGEAVCAVVVHEGRAELSEYEFREKCRQELGGYKSPKRVIFMDEIPMTPFGKADKKALRKPYWAERSRTI